MKFKIFTFLTASCLSCTPLLITSCSSNKKEEEKHNPQILFGDQRSFFVEVPIQKTETSISINGFSYIDLPSKNLSVTFVTIDNQVVSTASIKDFDELTKTFNVEIKFSNCGSSATTSGLLEFKCADQKVTFFGEAFHFSFYQKISIRKPTSGLSKNVVLKHGIGTTTFSKFTYAGDIISPDLLTCKFIPESLVVIESCKIKNISSKKKTFDIEISVSGCSSNQTISGNFEFYFNGNKVAFDGKANNFKLTFLEEIYIAQSTDNNVEAFYSTGVEAIVTFKNFRFNGISSPNQIQIIANFTNNGQKKTIVPFITNFDTNFKTFDLNFKISSENDIGDWQGTIEFKSKVTQQSILKTTTMNFSILFAIPEDYLDIQKIVKSGIQYFVLNGIKTTYPSDPKFNSLLIPSQISEIADSAFDSKISSTGKMKTIKYLAFDKNIYLKRIGESAFNNCSLLTNNLILPSSITEIGSKAFYNCKNFNGKLSIPSNQSSTTSPQLPIGSYAFQNCKFKELDISDYPLNFLPEWNLSTDNKIFSGWNQTGKIIVCDTVFYDETGYKQTLQNKLSGYSLPAKWTFSNK